MRAATKMAAVEIAKLNSIPAERRREDWHIAKGLLTEAAQYIKIRQDLLAEAMVKAAQPYVRFAELAQ